jgi:hypothetical protein
MVLQNKSLSAVADGITVAGTAPDFTPVFPFNSLMLKQQENRESTTNIHSIHDIAKNVICFIG